MKTPVLVLTALLTLTACAGTEPTSTASGSETVVETETVTKIVEQTPQACLDALDAAEGVTAQAARGFELAALWPPLVQRAAMAGLNRSASEIEAITAEMTAGNEVLNDITGKTEVLVSEYRLQAEECRSGATPGE